MLPHKSLGGGELHATKMLFVVAIALVQPSWISVHAADVSAEAKAAVEEVITELGCRLIWATRLRQMGTATKLSTCCARTARIT